MNARLSSACPLDCPDACSLEISVRDGRIVRIDGTRVNPLTQGFICAKVRKFGNHVYSAERVLHPALRVGAKGEGRFRRISWAEALERIAALLRETRDRWGGEAILPFSYGGSNGLLSQDTTDARLFHRMGASRLARTVCSAPTRLAAEGLYGRMPTGDFEEYAASKLVVLWGVNPSATGIHLVPILQRARQQGAKLAVVDPRVTPLAGRADLHLALRPGTDLPLALGVLRWLFEEGGADYRFLHEHATGVEHLREKAKPWNPPKVARETGLSEAQVESFAKLYAASSPAMIRCGWGHERNRNGGSATAAILALPAVGGKFGVRGGGYSLSNSGAFPLDPLRAAAAPPPTTREINMNLLGETLLGATVPPVKFLFVYNANPLSTLPRQERVREGLRREDLYTVVFEQVMTDTARFADLLLPAATFLERRELSRGYGAQVLQDASPAIAPVGESRSNQEVFAQLCRLLDLTQPGEPETDEEIARAILAGHPEEARIRSELQTFGIAHPRAQRSPVPFIDTFPRTRDRKVHLFPEELERSSARGLYEYEGDPATSQFPLALISPATDRTVSSTLGQAWTGQARLDIHPADAERRQILDGECVRVFNDLGEVRVRARITPEVRPGVLVLPKGLWSRHTLNGATSNALCPDTLSDLGGGACFNDARVQVERFGTPSSS